MNEFYENSPYRHVCLKAAAIDKEFNNFKRNSIYTHILEHVARDFGQLYIDFILKTKLDLSKIDKLKENDEQGNPVIENYQSPFNDISPSTLRYIKVLSELEMLFGSLDGKRIIEIGVGYGGQSKVIMDYFKISEYVYVDLMEPILLTKRYLKKYNYNNLNYYCLNTNGFQLENVDDNSTWVPAQPYDLLISNYAFSELNRSIQDFYLKVLINNAKSGYMTCNAIFNDIMAPNEIKDRIPNSYFIEEVPLSHYLNYILIWK